MHDCYDVIVCGAGPAGITASLAAARRGARTLLVDEDANPGGSHIDHFILALCGEPFEGLTKEIADSLAAIDSSFARGWPHVFDVHNYLVVVRRKLREAGVEFLPHTRIHGSVTEGDWVTGITFTRRNEAMHKEAIVTGKVIIDSTGNGDVSFFSGVPYRFGREARSEFDESFAPEVADRHVQQLTWMYQVAKTRETDKKPSHAHYDDGRYLIWGGGFDCPDPTDPSALEATQDEAWRAMETQFARHQENGFRVVAVAPKMGIRETRRIMGDYIIHENDLRNAIRFDDRICRANYPLDPWEPKGKNPYWTANNRCELPFYFIPYRCLCARGKRNLLLAGRCISGTHVAMSSYRVTTIASLMGEAAGTAAALAVAKDGDIRAIAITELQSLLRGNGIGI